MTDFQYRRYLAQSAEDAANPHRIGLDFKSPFPGNLAKHLLRLPASGPDAGDYIVRAVQRFTAVYGWFDL